MIPARLPARGVVGRIFLVIVASVAACAALAPLLSGAGETGAAAAKADLVGPGVVSTLDHETAPALSADGSAIYYTVGSPDFPPSSFRTIVSSLSRDGRWQPPEVAPFSGTYSDTDPFVLPGGDRLFFASARPVTARPSADVDLWSVQKDGGGWKDPENMGRVVNSDAREASPSVAASGTLYFASNRPGGAGGFDIWRSVPKDRVYGPPENLGAPINTPGPEIDCFIASDESFLLFTAIGRPGSKGSADIYISRRAGATWSAPVIVGPPVSTGSWEATPRLAADGKTLLFMSARPAGAPDRGRAFTYQDLLGEIRSPGNGLGDIYQVSAAVLEDLR